MILQSTKVLKALEHYYNTVPEVPLRYKEDNRGIIVLVPQNFDNITPSTRAVAYAEIEKLMMTLTILQTNPRIQVGTHLV